MMPWKWNIGSVGAGAGFKNQQSAINVGGMMPFFYNHLEFIGNQAIIEKIVKGIVAAVKLGEDKFDQAFGGWMPNSNQFGIVPLRPQSIGYSDSRWQWTDSASASVDWSADDSFVASHQLESDELILVYGYFNLEPVPNTTELFIQPGANKLPIWNIEAQRASGVPYFIFPEPIIIEPRSTFLVQAATRSLTTQTVEEAGLLGFHFAPTARLITKEP